MEQSDTISGQADGKSDPLTECLCIDGWASSGKTTAARMVGVALGFPAIHTGMLYRNTALLWLTHEWPDWGTLARTASGPAAFETCVSWPSGEGNGPAGIWNEQVTLAVTRVAGIPCVREVLNRATRRFIAERGPAVLEGRDTATQIAPQACLRVFLTCAPEVRRARAKPSDHIIERDEADMAIAQRPAAADEYFEVDTEHIAMDVVTRIIFDAYVRARDRGGRCGGVYGRL